MLKPLLATALTAALLAGCSGTTLRYPVPVVPPDEKVSIRFRTVEVRQVSLPEYAELSEISSQNEDGGIVSDKSTIFS